MAGRIRDSKLAIALRENEDLRERIRRLEDALDQRYLVPPHWRLTPMEGKFVGMLLGREQASREALMAMLYGAVDQNDPYSTILSVMASKIRRKLQPHGVEIRSLRGAGYSIDAATRDRVAGEFVEDVTAAAA